MFTYTRKVDTGAAAMFTRTAVVNTSAAAITSSAALVITSAAEVITFNFHHKHNHRGSNYVSWSGNLIGGSGEHNTSHL